MNNTTANKTVKILSRHAKLSEAVKAANIDLSYNESLALSDLRYADKDKHQGEAFVVEANNGEVGVVFVFNCDIAVLNRYQPFHSCIDSAPFGFAIDKGDHFEFTERNMPKNKGMRAFIATTQKDFAKEGHKVYAY